MGQFERIDSVFVAVTDVEKSAKWYSDFLGLSLDIQDKEWKYYSLRMNDSEQAQSVPWVTLYEVKEVTPAEHMPFNLYTPNGLSVHQTLQQQGVKVTELMDTGGMLVFEVFDPDSNRIGIVSWPAKEHD